jgi:hypothetical protein
MTDKLIAKESTYVWRRLPQYENQVGKTYEQVMVEMMEKTEALESRVQRLEKALREIANKYYCQCTPASPIDSEGAYLCNRCIAKRALEGKG